MGISVITPHFNDFEGLKQTHACLSKQHSADWEWIIVDDYSDTSVKNEIKKYFSEIDSPKIKILFNDKKTTGSVCRNIGADHTNYDKIVFLDSDDIISDDFITNRTIEIGDFAVFRNTNILDEKGNNKPSPTATSNYLDHFLRAKFIWPITAVLWNKEYFIKIGKFNPDLKRLQDIELSIRALILSSNYKVLDNTVDFFYCVAPIDIKKRPVDIICESVNYLINYMHENYKLDKRQRGLVSGYYYLCVRYFIRSNNKKDSVFVQESLGLFYKLNYFSYFDYFKAMVFLKLYRNSLITSSLFIRLNRYFFK